MAQYDDVTTIDPNSTSGSQLGAIVQALIGHLLSGGYGVGVPSDAAAGYIGAENTGGTPEAYVFDGTDAVALYSLANAIGAVAADGAGENTGAIVEIGETAGTLWIKFAGGFAACFRKMTSLSGGSQIWDLPFAFTDTDKMYPYAGSASSSSGRFVNITVQNTSRVTAYGFSAANVAENFNVIAGVFGYWTEEFV